jgi:hypothetical protein
MKIITMYELLGMVKDDKELPKKVNVLDVIYEFDDHNGDYYNKSLDRYLFVYITSREEWKLAFYLDLQVEIIEEKEIPEKLPYYSIEKIQKAKNKDEWQEERITLLEKRVDDLHIKINEIIDYLKSKGE